MSSIEKDGWLYSVTSLSSGGQREARRGPYSAWWAEDGCHTDWPHEWGRPEWPADFDPQAGMAWTGFRA